MPVIFKSLDVTKRTMLQQFTFVYFFQDDCPTDPEWKQLNSLCYTVLLDTTNGVTYDEAKDRCSNINGTVIMPKTKDEADLIASNVIFGR